MAVWVFSARCMQSLLKVVAILIPTFCIFYIFTDLRPEFNPFYREIFGNGDLLLDVYYATNPQGALQRAPQDLRFRGFLVRGDEEVEVTGRRIDRDGQRLYLFESKFGRFEGRLAKNTKSCEPVLHFLLGDLNPTRGILRAGFCL